MHELGWLSINRVQAAQVVKCNGKPVNEWRRQCTLRTRRLTTTRTACLLVAVRWASLSETTVASESSSSCADSKQAGEKTKMATAPTTSTHYPMAAPLWCASTRPRRTRPASSIVRRMSEPSHPPTRTLPICTAGATTLSQLTEDSTTQCGWAERTRKVQSVDPSTCWASLMVNSLAIHLHRKRRAADSPAMAA